MDHMDGGEITAIIMQTVSPKFYVPKQLVPHGVNTELASIFTYITYVYLRRKKEHLIY